MNNVRRAEAELGVIILVLFGGFVLLSGIGGCCYVWPKYNVYEQEMAGQAEYAKAESTRKVTVLEAQAKLEAAKSLAAAEVERAKGVAQANQIIGESLKGNEDYLHYLWIQNLHEGRNDVIYVPTETGLPIMEAGRLGNRPPATAEKK